MSEQIGLEAVLEDADFMKAVASYNKSIDGMEKNTSGVATGITKGLAGLGKDFLGFGVQVGKALLYGTGAVVGAIGAVGAGIIALAANAAPLETIEAAFEGIADASGKSAQEVLSALQMQSAGMITNRDLMQTYNLAAQLVGDTFANQLPDAMGYLGKVAAATGEDMGFMLDSLVRGVGRLSPMILDNLGIQVDMVAANQAWAEANGVTVDSMSKEQQQAALMNQVLEKLADNTASMPDVAGSASQSFASLKTTFANLKDELGKRFLPVVQPVVDLFGDMAEKAIPKLLDFLDPLIDKFAYFIDVIKFLITGDMSFELFSESTTKGTLDNIVNLRDTFVNLWESIKGIFSGDTTVEGFFKSIQDVVLQIMATFGILNIDSAGMVQGVFDFVTQIVEWFTVAIPNAINFVIEHWDAIKAAIISVGAVLAAAGIITTIAGIVAAINPVSIAIAAIVAVAALLGAAWAENWGGIRDVLTQLWEENLKPAFESIKDWLEVVIPIAIAKAKEFWTNTLQPALAQVWDFIVTTLIPAFGDVVDWLVENVPIAIETAKDYWENTLKPALETVWAYIQENIIPVFQTVVAWLAENIPVAIQAASDFWENTLKPALVTIWNYINENILPIFQTVWDWLSTEIPAAIETAKSFWEETLLPALTAVWEFIDESILPIFDAIAVIINEGLRIAVEGMALLWSETLQPALEDIWTFIQDDLLPILDKIWVWFSETIVQPITDFIDNLGFMSSGVETVKKWFKDLYDLLVVFGEFLKTWDWGAVDDANEHSVPPLASGLMQVTDAGYNLMTMLRLMGTLLGSQIVGELYEFRDIVGQIGDAVGLQITAIESLDELVKAGSSLQGIGMGFVNKYKSEVVDPLKDQLDALNQAWEDRKAEGTVTQADVEDFLYQRQLLTNQIAENEERILKAQQQQADFQFLQQQMKLLDFVTEQGLNPAEVFEGFTFGLDASLPDLIDAINHAMELVIAKANETLQIQSPSKIFMDMGENVGGAFASGIGNMESTVASYVGAMMGGFGTEQTASTYSSPSDYGLSTTTISHTLNADFNIPVGNQLDVEVLKQAIRTVIQEEFNQ